MVLKPQIRNWHREAFKEGRKDEIPAHVLQILEAEKADQKPEKVKKEKEEAK